MGIRGFWGPHVSQLLVSNRIVDSSELRFGFRFLFLSLKNPVAFKLHDMQVPRDKPLATP